MTDEVMYALDFDDSLYLSPILNLSTALIFRQLELTSDLWLICGDPDLYTMGADLQDTLCEVSELSDQIELHSRDAAIQGILIQTMNEFARRTWALHEERGRG